MASLDLLLKMQSSTINVIVDLTQQRAIAKYFQVHNCKCKMGYVSPSGLLIYHLSDMVSLWTKFDNSSFSHS